MLHRLWQFIQMIVFLFCVDIFPIIEKKMIVTNEACKKLNCTRPKNRFNCSQLYKRQIYNNNNCHSLHLFPIPVLVVFRYVLLHLFSELVVLSFKRWEFFHRFGHIFSNTFPIVTLICQPDCDKTYTRQDEYPTKCVKSLLTQILCEFHFVTHFLWHEEKKADEWIFGTQSEHKYEMIRGKLSTETQGIMHQLVFHFHQSWEDASYTVSRFVVRG